MKKCRACADESLKIIADFGPQPLCNRFLPAANVEEYTHPLSLAVCKRCGLVQLGDTAPANEVQPRFDWISYNEPQRHLDQLCDVITRLSGISPTTIIAGFSSEDESLLQRLQESGFDQTWRLDLREDLGVNEPRARLETVQARWNVDVAQAVTKRRGRPEVLLVRRVLEHAHDLRGFLAGIRALVAPTGYVVFEVPDCGRAFEDKDYSTLWEEHVSYFSPATLQRALMECGFSLVHVENYPYPLENSLVAIARANEQSAPTATAEEQETVAKEVARALEFGTEFESTRSHWQNTLTRWRREEGPVALLGAGHLSCTFLNLLQLAPFIEFVVDDNPHKQGLLMPGSRLPIYPSQALFEKRIRRCLMSVSPESESRVLERNHKWREQGGVFASIFPGSPLAARLDE